MGKLTFAVKSYMYDIRREIRYLLKPDDFSQERYLAKIQLREVVILKAAVGGLSEKNDGTDGNGTAPMLFPAGMQALDSPYVEAGVGLSNILNLFRVDCMWRLTHRDTARRNFMVAFGMEFKF